MAEIEAAGKKRARGGQVSRILDIEARGVEKTDRGVEIRRKDPFDGENIDSAALVDAIKEQARDNYGVARPAFVQALLDNKVDYAFLRKRVAEFVAKYKPEKAHSQIQRAAERFGVISVAGELAIEYGVLPWEAGASESAAAWAFKQWLERRGPGSFEERQAISAVRSIIERYGVSRFDPLVTPEGAEPSIDLDRHAPVRYGYRMPGAWLVFPEVFRNEFCSGLDHKRVAETLLEHGMLERSEEADNQTAAHQDAGRGHKTSVVLLDHNARSLKSGEDEAMTSVPAQKLSFSQRWKHRRAPTAENAASHSRQRQHHIAARALHRHHSPAAAASATAADRARIARWVAAQIVCWPPDNCFHCRRPIVYGAKWVELVNDNDRARFHFDCEPVWRAQQEVARPSGNGARPERTPMKLVTDWGVRSPRLDRLIAGESSHRDGSAGRMVHRDAGTGGEQVWLACCSLLMGRSPMWLLALVVVAAWLFASHH